MITNTTAQITVTKRFSFSLAHRLDPSYSGLCKSLHGHQYVMEVTFASNAHNKHGMVIDFGDIKTHFQGWINKNLDHAVIATKKDKSLIDWCHKNRQRLHVMRDDGANWHTTAEDMVEYIKGEFENLMIDQTEWRARGLRLVALRLYETQDSWAEWRA